MPRPFISGASDNRAALTEICAKERNKFMTLAQHPVRRRIGWIVALAALLLAVHPTLAQRNGDEHWVGTWATAVVGRPQNPPPPTAPPAQTAQGQSAPRQQPAPFV